MKSAAKTLAGIGVPPDRIRIRIDKDGAYVVDSKTDSEPDDAATLDEIQNLLSK